MGRRHRCRWDCAASCRKKPCALALRATLQGWRFGAGGHCTGIPQLAGIPGEDTALSSPRACATAYPTRQLGGLLWVWPDASEAGRAAAERVEPAIPPEVLDSLEGSTQHANQVCSWAWFKLRTTACWWVERTLSLLEVSTGRGAW